MARHGVKSINRQKKWGLIQLFLIGTYVTYQTAVEKPNQNSTSQSSYLVILNMYNLVCIQQILLLTFSN